MTRPVSLPLQDWPDADQRMWTSLTTAGDPFEDPGALSHLRATSQAALIKHYGRWLEWLWQSAPSSLDMRPELRASPEMLAAWISSLAHVAPPTLHTIVFGALRVLTAAAPDRDWSVQNLAARRLQRRAGRSHSDRKSGRILSSAVLFDVALELAGPKADGANTALNAALMRRDGAMIAFLSVLPIRLRSLSELTLGTSVRISPSRIMIELSEDMTKNGHAWKAQVPEFLEPVLRTYIAEVRPWLMRRHGAQHQSLWVGRMGLPLDYASIANMIPRVTARETGIAISPHLFRDMAATTLVRQSPADTRAIRALLGHRDGRTAERHYIHAKGIEAGRDYAAAIADLLASGRE